MATNRKNISIDSFNRLVVTDAFKKASYKATVDGVPTKRRLQKIALQGAWGLTPEHDLIFRVSGSQSDVFGKTIILRGDIKSVSGKSLTFRVKQRDVVSGLRTQTIELKGVWRADSNNRITFNVAKHRGRYDVLRFQGVWRINKSNELIYKYIKTELKTKIKKESILRFKGRWDFAPKRIVYSLEGKGNSFFSFKAELQSKKMRSSSGVIKYQIGIKYSRGRVYRMLRRVVTIYGRWKLNKKFKVGFEIKYSGGKKQNINFLVERLFGKDKTVTVFLKNKKGEILGLEVIFSKPFKGASEFFLSLGRSAGESHIVGGVRVRF